MERRIINPWAWQDAFGFVQANEVSGAQRTLYCAGIAAVDAEGHPVHAGDMAAQVAQSVENLEALLGEAGMTLANVVRLNYFTTDIDALFAVYGTLVERLGAAGCRPASTLLCVSRLAFPELLIEMEATAVA